MSKTKAPEIPKWKQGQIDQKAALKERGIAWDAGTTCNLGIKAFKREHPDGAGVGGYKDKQWRRVKALYKLKAEKK